MVLISGCFVTNNNLKSYFKMPARLVGSNKILIYSTVEIVKMDILNMFSCFLILIRKLFMHTWVSNQIAGPL